MHTTLAENKPPDETRLPLGAGRKLTAVQQTLLWGLLQADSGCPSRALLTEMAQRGEPISVSVRQINRLRVKWGLNRRQGRPRTSSSGETPLPRREGGTVVERLSLVGVHLFADWIEQEAGWDLVLSLLKQAIDAYQRTHPAADFPLLHHREETLLRRFQALFFAPLLGIEHLTEFDVKEHPLPTLLGGGYQSSTLSQFLGQLERIEAAEALRPALLPETAGPISYVDGHMIAFWSRVSMHKGKITMLGRIMAGSQAVIAHNEEGQALWVEYYPPDRPLSQVIVAYCQQVWMATGIAVFVIDRAVNSVAMAVAFTRQGWGLLSMLDDNEHKGLSSFEATVVGTDDEGNPVYQGRWKEPREADPRRFVLVESVERLSVYWGTPPLEKSVAPIEWPRLYRQRSEIQENGFRRMIDHGALNTNYGRKKQFGPDRHQQRAQEKLHQALAGAQAKVEKKEDRVHRQQEKVAESTQKGHTTRLHQRQRTLAVEEEALKMARQQHEKLAQQVETLGPSQQRADRDFRKQRIMTLRTLLLENGLLAFLVGLGKTLQEKLCLESLLKILFERSGIRLETDSEIRYWVNTAGLSSPYQRQLAQIVEGLNTMSLRRRGKPIRVQLKHLPDGPRGP